MTIVQIKFDENEGRGLTADMGGWLITDFQELSPEEWTGVAFDIRLPIAEELLKMFGDVKQDKEFSHNIDWLLWNDVVKEGTRAELSCKAERYSLAVNLDNEQARRLTEYLADGNHMSSDLDSFRMKDIGTPEWLEVRGQARLLWEIMEKFPESLPGVIWKDLEPRLAKLLGKRSKTR